MAVCFSICPILMAASATRCAFSAACATRRLLTCSLTSACSMALRSSSSRARITAIASI
eukprot:CAMPEP_0198222416 /NCGR_PEP_ID=MMETSP1445-20131203/87987_1 /TAXON_ID=36898 /ORGANISM="Pyramimonas sp., Strain CCMP2087" /LENGTH=58 /DNA_ID=CAMNT_0043900917 /DNA_START=47 /DNA_END=223 /DNA_ORIENTATION=+